MLPNCNSRPRGTDSSPHLNLSIVPHLKDVCDATVQHSGAGQAVFLPIVAVAASIGGPWNIRMTRLIGPFRAGRRPKQFSNRPVQVPGLHGLENPLMKATPSCVAESEDQGVLLHQCTHCCHNRRRGVCKSRRSEIQRIMHTHAHSCMSRRRSAGILKCLLVSC